jgi:membrane-associated phospholipid phosphatase
MSETPPAWKNPFCTRVLVALAFFAALLLPVRMADHSLFPLLNGLHSPETDSFWLTLTTLGDGLLMGLIAGAFVVVNPRVTVMAILVLVLSSWLTHVVKAVYPSLRPVLLLDGVHVVGPLLRSGSFPSGHAASGISVALAIAFFSGSTSVRLAALAFGACIGLSRIFVGAHFPGDVLGGFIVGLSAFLLVERFLWPIVEHRVPARPAYSARSFELAFWAEATLAMFVTIVYATRFAESPMVAEVLGLAVLALLMTWRFVKV